MLDTLLQFDSSAYQWINSGLSNPILDYFLIPMRHKLFWIPVYLFIVSFIIYNFPLKKHYIFLFIGATIFLSDTISSKVIKKTVQRERPCHLQTLTPVSRIHCSHGYSFTSSHATNHFAIATFLFGLFSFFKFRIIFFLWASVISFAQVYVGVHYPLDVIVGAIIGFLIGLITFVTFNYLVKIPKAIDI